MFDQVRFLTHVIRLVGWPKHVISLASSLPGNLFPAVPFHVKVKKLRTQVPECLKTGMKKRGGKRGGEEESEKGRLAGGGGGGKGGGDSFDETHVLSGMAMCTFKIA